MKKHCLNCKRKTPHTWTGHLYKCQRCFRAELEMKIIAGFRKTKRTHISDRIKDEYG